MSIHALVTDKTDAGYVTEMNEVAEADLGEGEEKKKLVS